VKPRYTTAVDEAFTRACDVPVMLTMGNPFPFQSRQPPGG
jgi:hypothetical protein